MTTAALTGPTPAEKVWWIDYRIRRREGSKMEAGDDKKRQVFTAPLGRYVEVREEDECWDLVGGEERKSYCPMHSERRPCWDWSGGEEGEDHSREDHDDDCRKISIFWFVRNVVTDMWPWWVWSEWDEVELPSWIGVLACEVLE